MTFHRHHLRLHPGHCRRRHQRTDAAYPADSCSLRGDHYAAYHAGAEGIENAIMLSDYFDHSFGRDYALLINEWHLLARAVFVLDTDNTIRYVEYVDNINSEPNFEVAIAAAKAL